MDTAKFFRNLVLLSLYLLGVIGIVASGGGGECSDVRKEGELVPSNPCSDYSSPSTSNPTPPSPFVDSVDFIATAIDGSDDVYVGGDFTTLKNSAANRIARLNNDGSLDTSFITGTGFNDKVQIIVPALDGSGDVYVGGQFTDYNGSAVGHIARLNLDGTLDAAFDTGTGFSSGIFGNDYSSVLAIAPAIDGSGDVYVGGIFTSYNGTDVGGKLVRLNADGSLDTGFLPIGFNFTILVPNGVALANDGSGDVYATIDSSIARLNSDGSQDSGFDTGLSGFGGEVLAIVVATDGSGDVYASGFFSDYNGTGRNNIARLNSDGSLDAGFVPDPGLLIWGRFFTLAIDGSGDIYVSISLGATISRLNGNGSIDTGFDMGSGGDGGIHSVAPVNDGSGDIYVGGSFTLLRFPPDDIDVPVDNLARLTSGGLLVK